MIENLLGFVDTRNLGDFSLQPYIIEFDLLVDCDLSSILMQSCFLLGSN